MMHVDLGISYSAEGYFRDCNLRSLSSMCGCWL